MTAALAATKSRKKVKVDPSLKVMTMMPMLLTC
jgi:hypothetical protein